MMYRIPTVIKLRSSCDLCLLLVRWALVAGRRGYELRASRRQSKSRDGIRFRQETTVFFLIFMCFVPR